MTGQSAGVGSGAYGAPPSCRLATTAILRCRRHGSRCTPLQWGQTLAPPLAAVSRGCIKRVCPLWFHYTIIPAIQTVLFLHFHKLKLSCHYIFQPLNCLIVSLCGIIHAFLFDMQPTMASGLVSLRHLLHSIIAFVDIQRWRGFSAWGAAILAAGGRRWNGGPTVHCAVRIHGGHTATLRSLNHFRNQYGHVKRQFQYSG